MKKYILVLFLVMWMTNSVTWAASNEMSLKVKEPGAGAEWTLGATSSVQWSFRGELGQTVLIRLQRVGWINAQRTLSEAAPIGAGRSGSFKWLIPADLPAGDEYTMTVMAENGISDTSEPFKLIAGKTTVSKLSLEAFPKGGERWVSGMKVLIRWSYAGNPGQSVKLALIKKDEGTVTVIAPSSPVGAEGKGSFEWTVPPLKPAADYYVGIVSIANSFYQDTGKVPVVISAAK